MTHRHSAEVDPSLVEINEIHWSCLLGPWKDSDVKALRYEVDAADGAYLMTMHKCPQACGVMGQDKR